MNEIVLLKVYMKGNEVWYSLLEGDKIILDDKQITNWEIFLMSMDAIKNKHPKVKLEKNCFEFHYNKAKLQPLLDWTDENGVEMI